VNNASVIVPLDGSEQALSALPVAKAFADHLRATLQIVHVAERDLPPLELITRLGLEPEDVRGNAIHPRHGDPVEAILETAREIPCRLIVLSTATDSADTKALGSTAEGVLRHSSDPLVLVPPRRGVQPFSLDRILLPHDGTPTTSEAIRHAAELAGPAGSELTVLHVAAPGTSPPERGSLTPPFYSDQGQHEWPAWTEEFIERITSIVPLETHRLRMVLGHGEPAAEIVDHTAAHPIDLIVLAWRGDWDSAHAGVLKQVIASSRCPTLVVRAESPYLRPEASRDATGRRRPSVRPAPPA
jgi:nucleotide-binding universal stress UspA family protein